MVENRFPEHLLKQSVNERLNYFKSYTIAHPILQEVYAALMQAIKEPAGIGIIFVFGPTGIGKTTLRLRVEQHIKEAALSSLSSEPGKIPIAGIEAAAPDAGNFHWKDYYRRALLALEEPLVDQKIRYNARGVSRDSEGYFYLDRVISAATLRYALENALKYRRPNAFFIDEAQHLTKMASGRKLQDQLDAIKSLANIADTIHVLVGTYELLPFRNLSGQLSRRSLDIHFRRYSARCEADLEAFKNVLFSFQRRLPFAQEPNLIEHWEYCYEQSLGCVGILKDWIYRALGGALEEDSATLTLKHLEKKAIPLSQCEKMAKDLLEGETELAENSQSRNRLRSLLGLETRAELENTKTMLSSANESKSISRRGGYVGKRNPKRDKIGT